MSIKIIAMVTIAVALGIVAVASVAMTYDSDQMAGKMKDNDDTSSVNAADVPGAHDPPTEPPPLTEEQLADYEKCVKDGGMIQESYPTVCVTNDGTTFRGPL